MKKYLLLLVVFALLLPWVSAATPILQVNQSYTMSNNVSTPLWVFGGFVALAFGTMFASFILTPKQRADLFGYISPLPFLISTLSCTGLSGIETRGASGMIGTSTVNEYIILENHIIYINDLLAMFLFIMFIISVVNCFRVYMEHSLFQQSVGAGVSNDE